MVADVVADLPMTSPSAAEVLGVVAGVLSAAGFVPYVLAILRRTTTPSRASWLIWSVIGSVLAAGHLAAGGGASLWVPLSYCVGPILTFVLALRYGEGGTSRFDRACLAVAGASLVAWALAGDPLVALVVNIGIDALGALPTLRKAWQRPESEDWRAWSLFAAGNVVNLFAVERWASAALLYPLYLVVVSGVVVAFIALRPRARAQGADAVALTRSP